MYTGLRDYVNCTIPVCKFNILIRAKFKFPRHSFRLLHAGLGFYIFDHFDDTEFLSNLPTVFLLHFCPYRFRMYQSKIFYYFCTSQMFSLQSDMGELTILGMLLYLSLKLALRLCIEEFIPI